MDRMYPSFYASRWAIVLIFALKETGRRHVSAPSAENPITAVPFVAQFATDVADSIYLLFARLSFSVNQRRNSGCFPEILDQ